MRWAGVAARPTGRIFPLADHLRSYLGGTAKAGTGVLRWADPLSTQYPFMFGPNLSATRCKVPFKHPGGSPMGAGGRGILRPVPALPLRQRRGKKREPLIRGSRAVKRGHETSGTCRRYNRRSLWEKNPVCAALRTCGTQPETTTTPTAVDALTGAIRQNSRTSSLIGLIGQMNAEGNQALPTGFARESGRQRGRRIATGCNRACR